MANIEQQVLWTLLPNGIDRDRNELKLSLVVSPRLTLTNTAPEDLSHFPVWLDWPARVQNATFAVSVNGGGAQPLEFGPEVDLRSDLWEAIFPKETYVQSYAFDDLRGVSILSYPAATIAKSLRKIYGEAGGAPADELPSRNNLRQIIFGSSASVDPATGGRDAPQRERIPPEEILTILRRETKSLDKRLRDGKRPRYSDLLSSAGNSNLYSADVALDLLATYHRPLQQSKTDSYAQIAPNADRPDAQWESFERTPRPLAQDYQQEIDFHRIVSSLMQHYELCRRCGLVIDLRLAADAVPNGAHKLALKVGWPSQGGSAVTQPDIIPVVNVQRAVFAFHARPELAASPIEGRYLRLQDGPFDFVQMDVDGGAMKVKNFAETLALGDPPRHANDDSFNPKNVEDENATGLPALRGGGLMLAQQRMDLALQALVYRAGALQDGVSSGGGPDELFAEDLIRGYRVDIREESRPEWRSLFRRRVDMTLVNTGGAFMSEDEEGMARMAAAGSPDQNNPDILKLSESLFTWTGWSLSAPEPGKIIDNDDAVNPQNEETPPGLPIEPVYRVVPKSLPALRFGKTYRARVRIVDIAGASEIFAEDSLTPGTAISEPVTFKRHEPVESPALALVRDGAIEEPGYGGDMGHIVIRSYNETPDLNTTPTSESSRRSIFAPRTNHRFAEHHGVLDTGPGGAPNPGLYQLLADQDVALEEAQLQTPGPGDTTYAVADADAEIPYIPDPLAIGAALRISGAAGFDPTKTIKGFFYGDHATQFSGLPTDWPKARALKIVVREGPNNVIWNAGDRQFEISLEKAERLRIKLASIVPTDAWRMMEIVDMIREENPGLNQKALIEEINASRHWMITPWRKMTITHAVQKPLITPEFVNGIGIRRAFGKIEATPYFRQVPLDAKSTGRVDMLAEWNEPLDDPAAESDPAKAGPIVRPHTAVAFDKKLARDETPSKLFDLNTATDEKLHVFSDTRYRRVEYRLDATTRYKEFLDPAVRADPARLKVTSPRRVAWIPNSAPPPQPNIVYAVPTFGWSRTESGDQKRSMRTGGGIRVYLDRPWFDTGFTEMLGVMLPPESASMLSLFNEDIYKDSVTMWGADPIWANADVKGVAPSRTSFPLARWAAPISFEGMDFPPEEGQSLPSGDFKGGRNQNLPHPDAGGRQLRVAPHAVGYDEERGLYYCDIVVTPPRGSYFPFIRLALARYNPISVDGAHLSPIVMTNVQQLTPDRLAVVTRKSANLVEISVYGDVITTQRLGQSRLPICGIFGVEIQVLDDGGDPELDWRKVEEPGDPPDSLTLGAAAPSVAETSRSAVTRRSQLLATRRSQVAPTTDATREIESLIERGQIAQAIARRDFAIAWQRPLLWQKEVRLPLVSAGARRRLMVVEAEAYQAGERGSRAAIPSTRAVSSARLPPIGGRFVYFETIDV
ncbi:MAG: hypothetical protein AAFW81_06260 [Pseudomonadota bacterium]